MIEILNCRVEMNDTALLIKLPGDRLYEYRQLAKELTDKRIDQMYVKIGKPKRIRTTGEKSQNHHFNGHVQQIAGAVGDYFDDMKMNIKRKAIAKGYRYKENAFGDVVPLSETEATTIECGYLIDTAHEVASFLGVTLRED